MKYSTKAIKMKKLILAAAALAAVLTSCDFGGKYTIKGTVSNLESEMVYLKEFKSNEPTIIDSAKVVDNKFIFEGKVEETKKCYIFKNKKARRPLAGFYVENTNINIELDAKKPENIKITGGEVQAVADEFNAISKKLEEDTKPLNDKYMSLMQKKAELGDKFEAEVNKLREEYGNFMENSNKEIKKLISKHLNSVVAADKFARLFNEYDFKEAKEIANKFTDEATTCSSIVKIKEKISILENVQIGKPAPDFTLNTPEGTPLTMSSFKGKMLIIDFWASWCGPCRGENPNVVKMYNKYHEKGLEILGVSLDDKKANWIKAIKDDGLIWNHVSDLKGWSSSAAKLYGVSGIPHIILIDQKGIIIAKNLRGEELENKLKEYIK